MSTLFSTPELEAYLVLGQELIRRVYADDQSPEELHGWLTSQLDRLANAGHESARMTWQESFVLYEEIMAKRKAGRAVE